jgi:hypothetical protein
MKKLGKDLLMFAQAWRTRGFWRDLRHTMVVPLIIAVLSFEARSDFDIVLVWSLFVAAVLWFAWYALTDGYVTYTYGTPHRFTVSELHRIQAYLYVSGFIHDSPRRYSLPSYRPLIVEPGDTFFVLKPSLSQPHHMDQPLVGRTPWPNGPIRRDAERTRSNLLRRSCATTLAITTSGRQWIANLHHHILCAERGQRNDGPQK